MRKTAIYVATLLLLIVATKCSTDDVGQGSEEMLAEDGLQCGTEAAMIELYSSNSASRREAEAFEQFTAEKSDQLSSGRIAATTATIPVVFHVYGTDFAGKSVTLSTIQTALQKVNDDFHGLNDDFASVDSYFVPVRSTSPITFKLATKDPSGQPTTGVVFHPVKNGYGSRTYDSEVAADAWDNKKYCNVYIQLDLYDDGALNNSGVAWYPDQGMTNANTARIVYNGRYLYGNTDKEFASTLSHEFGHYMNLIHTFEGRCNKRNENYCSTTGDRVCDTPQASSNDLCSTLTNCANKRVNTENYMGYSGARGCYKMFTAGQVSRMDAALSHSARFPLWQSANLTATGTN